MRYRAYNKCLSIYYKRISSGICIFVDYNSEKKKKKNNKKKKNK